MINFLCQQRCVHPEEEFHCSNPQSLQNCCGISSFDLVHEPDLERLEALGVYVCAQGIRLCPFSFSASCEEVNCVQMTQPLRFEEDEELFPRCPLVNGGPPHEEVCMEDDDFWIPTVLQRYHFKIGCGKVPNQTQHNPSPAHSQPIAIPS